MWSVLRLLSDSLISSDIIIPTAFMPTGYIVFVFPFVCLFIRYFVC